MGKEDSQLWLKRAESNLKLAKVGKIEGIALEDLCFEAQQSAEKSLKALLIHFQDEFPRVHSFSVLLERLEKYMSIPKHIEDVLELSDYAVEARYPGDYFPITQKEYEKAIEIAEKVFIWVREIIGKK